MTEPKHGHHIEIFTSKASWSADTHVLLVEWLEAQGFKVHGISRGRAG